jgi:SAM-dependent methyltransferase
MDQSEKDFIVKRYTDRFNELGYSPKTLGWFKKRHFLRYKILLDNWEYNNNSLLDFGCGFGDMYSYIKQHQLKIDYFGVDINSILINKGKSLYKDINLSCCDFLNLKNRPNYDFIVSSGVHNLKLTDNISFINKTFKVFNESSKQGFSINFLSDKCQYFENDLYYTSPEYILKIAYNYSNNIILRNDYMPYEFTLIVNKNTKIDNDHTVYTSFIKYI